ncbi:MAG: DUF302 domain-containing protein [Acidobacteriia bacterium]|nr:DUF302 domain-containing protein [Methyloceanibacter sp.]MBX5471491.1 DUF302 domain-containing protein [Acetobacteraceae bacterium]MCL6490867.1 DUF302 domain-containing protein [Terriglobia bacterium]
MSYYFAKTLDVPFDTAIARTLAALKERGFGLVSEIDVKETLKQKIGVEFRPYRILGACNPKLAHRALTLEDKVGTMLPCNVIVQELEPGKSEVAAIDPVASMQAINNPRLRDLAEEVRRELQAVVQSL